MHSLLRTLDIVCPFCWEKIQFDIDLSAGGLSYIEDCSVCCHPIEIGYEVDGGEISNLRIEKAM